MKYKTDKELNDIPDAAVDAAKNLIAAYTELLSKDKNIWKSVELLGIGYTTICRLCKTSIEIEPNGYDNNCKNCIHYARVSEHRFPCLEDVTYLYHIDLEDESDEYVKTRLKARIKYIDKLINKVLSVKAKYK